MQRVLFLLFLLWHSTSSAQSVIDVAKHLPNPIGDKTYHFYDRDKSLTFDQVRKLQFQTRNRTIPNYGYNTGADWIKFSICNSADHTISKVLRINKPIIDSIGLYLGKEENYERELSGALVGKGDSSLYSTSNYFNLEVNPQDTLECYLRVVSMHSKQLSMHIEDSEDHISYEQGVIIVIGFILGGLFIITFYNLFLGFGIKDPVYLFYALSNLGALLATMTLKGFFSAYVYFDRPDVSLFMVPVQIISFSIFSSFFCIRMVSIKKYSLIAYYMFYVVIGFGVIAVVYPLIRYNMGLPATFEMLSYAAFLFTIVAVTSGVIAIRNGDRNARYYLFAWLIGLIGVLLYGMLLIGILPLNFFTENLYVMGSVAEVLVLSFALGDRYNSILLEKNELQKNLKFKEGDLAMVISDNRMRLQFKNKLLDQLQGLNDDNSNGIKTKLNSLINDLKLQVQKEERLDYFEEHVDLINTEFESKLKDKFPGLTKSELEISYLIKLKLSNKDIAQFRNTSEGAIKVAKHRIRKKIEAEGGNLERFIQNID